MVISDNGASSVSLFDSVGFLLNSLSKSGNNDF
jgi:hypothetical protein